MLLKRLRGESGKHGEEISIETEELDDGRALKCLRLDYGNWKDIKVIKLPLHATFEEAKGRGRYGPFCVCTMNG